MDLGDGVRLWSLEFTKRKEGERNDDGEGKQAHFK